MKLPAMSCATLVVVYVTQYAATLVVVHVTQYAATLALLSDLLDIYAQSVL